MEPSPESQHVTSSSSSFFFSYPPSRNPASLQSFLSGALRNGQIGGDPLQVSHASSESPIRIRTEVRVMRTHRTHHPTGLEREPEVASDPSVASQPASRSRNSHSSRSQTTTTRTAPTIAVKSEPESEEAPVRPNTRSRKRQHTEQSKSAASVLPPKKRKRAPKQPVQLKKPPPGSKSEEEDEKKPSAELTSCCCICMCDVEHEELALINGCEHQFCFGCIEKWAERENTCPLCKMRFNKIDRVNRRRKKGTKNTKKVKQRDQRSDLVPGAALEGLLANFASRHPFPPQSIARLIFSGVGNGFIEFNSGHGPSLRGRAAGRPLSAAAADDSYSSDDDDDNPFTGFFRAVHGRSVMMGAGMPALRPVSFTTHITSRSYASNGNDRSAGNGAENPLEIEDDSDDEEVEVVQVMRP